MRHHDEYRLKVSSTIKGARKPYEARVLLSFFTAVQARIAPAGHRREAFHNRALTNNRCEGKKKANGTENLHHKISH